MLMLSVAICTRNRAQYLQNCLSSLAKQGADTSKYEIIVVDNGSVDNTLEVVNQFRDIIANIEYVLESKPGLSVARNKAIEVSNGELIAYLDDDAVANADWVEKVIVSWSTHSADCFGGKVIPIWEGLKPPWLTEKFESNYSLLDYSDSCRQMIPPDHPWGVNIVFNRKKLSELGGFPEDLGRVGERLLSGEETWVCRKIYEQNGSIWYDPSLIVRHCISSERMKVGWLRRRIFWGGVSDSVYMMKSNDSKKLCNEKSRKKLMKIILQPKQLVWLCLSFITPCYLEKASNCIYKIGFIYGVVRYRCH